MKKISYEDIPPKIANIVISNPLFSTLKETAIARGVALTFSYPNENLPFRDFSLMHPLTKLM